MKKATLILFILIPFFSFAQIDVLGGVGFLFIKQNGFVLNESATDPQLLQKEEVQRTLSTFGETWTAFYHLEHFSVVPRKISIGPQAGIGFYFTKLSKSVDTKYKPDKSASRFKKTLGPSHIPLEFAVRFGSLANPDNGPFGASFSAGIDLFYLHIADEKAFTMLPCGSITLMKGRAGVRLGLHFLKYRSVFNTNFGQVTRLSNTLTSFEFVLAL